MHVCMKHTHTHTYIYAYKHPLIFCKHSCDICTYVHTNIYMPDYICYPQNRGYIWPTMCFHICGELFHLIIKF